MRRVLVRPIDVRRLAAQHDGVQRNRQHREDRGQHEQGVPPAAVLHQPRRDRHEDRAGERARERHDGERAVAVLGGEPARHRPERGLVERGGQGEPHQRPDHVGPGQALQPRPGDQQGGAETRAHRHGGPWPSAIEPAPHRQGRERRDAHADREGAGDRSAGGSEIALHRGEEDGEPVVEDAPGHGFGDGERRDDAPAVAQRSCSMIRTSTQRPSSLPCSWYTPTGVKPMRR
jgi:hypothetical protein